MAIIRTVEDGTGSAIEVSSYNEFCLVRVGGIADKKEIGTAMLNEEEIEELINILNEFKKENF